MSLPRYASIADGNEAFIEEVESLFYDNNYYEFEDVLLTTSEGKSLVSYLFYQKTGRFECNTEEEFHIPGSSIARTRITEVKSGKHPKQSSCYWCEDDLLKITIRNQEDNISLVFSNVTDYFAAICFFILYVNLSDTDEKLYNEFDRRIVTFADTKRNIDYFESSHGISIVNFSSSGRVIDTLNGNGFSIHVTARALEYSIIDGQTKTTNRVVKFGNAKSDEYVYLSKDDEHYRLLIKNTFSGDYTIWQFENVGDLYQLNLMLRSFYA